MNLSRFEAGFFRLVTVGLAALVLAQAYLHYDDLRLFFNYTDRVEVLEALGYPGRSTVGAETVTIRLLVVSQPAAPEVRLLVNGREEARFVEGQVVLRVVPGDRLAIDGRGEPGLVRYRVVQVSPGVVAPPEGWEFETVGTLEALGTVQFEGGGEGQTAPLP